VTETDWFMSADPRLAMAWVGCLFPPEFVRAEIDWQIAEANTEDPARIRALFQRGYQIDTEETP
jgi:hypothetical protein